MTRRSRVYRIVISLYPKHFRTRHRDDLEQAFADLVRCRGASRAWRRTLVDVAVTVPRYRLEAVMSSRRSSATLSAVIGGLGVAGAASVVTGLYPGALLLAVAAVIAIGQRSRLAQSLRPADPNRRRRRFRTAAILGLVCIASLASYTYDLHDEHISDASLILHNLAGVPSMISSIGFLVAALLTRPPAHGPDGTQSLP
jgi:hypothetical protein